MTSLPCKFMRGMAGFNPTIAGNYYIARAKIMPPAMLEALVLPKLDSWQVRFQNGDIDNMDMVGIPYMYKYMLIIIGCSGIFKAISAA